MWCVSLLCWKLTWHDEAFARVYAEASIARRVTAFWRAWNGSSRSLRCVA